MRARQIVLKLPRRFISVSLFHWCPVLVFVEKDRVTIRQSGQAPAEVMELLTARLAWEPDLN